MVSSSSDVEVAIRKAFRRLGYPDAKEEQLKAAREFISGRYVFVCLPTGSRKSMCYGCLPYAFDELAANSFKDSSTNAKPSAIVLIVSPLTALMEDQVKQFTDMGLKAAFVGEAQDDQSVERRVKNGEYSLVYESRVNDDSVAVERNVSSAIVPAAPEGHSDRRSSLHGEVVSMKLRHSTRVPGPQLGRCFSIIGQA